MRIYPIFRCKKRYMTILTERSSVMNIRLSSGEFIMLLRTQSEALDPSGFSLVPLIMGIKGTITNLLEKLGL